MIRQVRVAPVQDSQNSQINQVKASNDTLFIPGRSSSSEFIRTIKQHSPEPIQKVSQIQYISSQGIPQLRQQNIVNSNSNQVVAAPGQKDKHRSLSPCNQQNAQNGINMFYVQDSIQNQNFISSPLSSTTNSLYQAYNNQQNQNQKKPLNIPQQQINVNKQGQQSPLPLQQIQINNNQLQQQNQTTPGIQVLKGQQIQQNQLHQQPPLKVIQPLQPMQVQQTQQNDQVVYTLGGKVNDLSKEIQRLLTLNEKLIQEALSWRQKFELCNMRKQILEQELEQRKLLVQTYSQNLNLNDESSNMNDTDEKQGGSCQSNQQDQQQNWNKKKQNQINLQSDQNGSESSYEAIGCTDQNEKRQMKQSSKDYNFQHIVRQISSLESLKKMTRVEDLHQQIEKLIDENEQLKQQMRQNESSGSDDIFSDSSFVLDETEEEDLRKQNVKAGDYYSKYLNQIPEQDNQDQVFKQLREEISNIYFIQKGKMSQKQKIKWKMTNLGTKCAKLEKELTEWKIQNWNLQKQIQSYEHREEAKDLMLQKLEQEKQILHSSLSNKMQDLESGIQKFTTQSKSFYQFIDNNNIFYHQQTNQLTPKNSSTNIQFQQPQHHLQNQPTFNVQQGSPKSFNSSTNNNKYQKHNQNQFDSSDQLNKQEGSEYRYHSDQNKNSQKNKVNNNNNTSLELQQQQQSSTSSNGYAKEIIEKALNYAGDRNLQINNPSQSVKTIEFNYNQSFSQKNQLNNNKNNRKISKEQQNQMAFTNTTNSNDSLQLSHANFIPTQQVKKNTKINNFTLSNRSPTNTSNQQQSEKNIQQVQQTPSFQVNQLQSNENINKSFSDFTDQMIKDEKQKTNDFSNFEVTSRQYQNEMQKLAEKQKFHLQRLQEKAHNRELSILKDNEQSKTQEESGSQNKFNYEFQNVKKISATQKTNIQQAPQYPLSEYNQPQKGSGGSVNRYQQDFIITKNQYQEDLNDSFHNNNNNNYNYQTSDIHTGTFSKFDASLSTHHENNKINAFNNNEQKLLINNNNTSNKNGGEVNSIDKKLLNNNDQLYASASSESFRVNHSFSDKENNFSSHKKSFQQQLSPQFVYQSNDSFQPNQNY